MNYSQWPEEIIEAYENIAIPSFYDFVLANERLSAEIKKQNKDLKAIYGILSKLFEDFSLLQEEKTSGNDQKELKQALEQHYLTTKKQDQEILIQTADSMRLFVEAIDTTLEEIFELLKPQKKIFGIKKVDSKQIKKKVLQIKEGALLSNKKLLSSLSDLGLELITPKSGERFSPAEHRCVETITGGTKGTICETIRIGYKNQERILRFADVVTYIG